MQKAYTRINWQNYPETTTPLNEENLNKIDAALDEVDRRVVQMDTTKLDVATANTMVKSVSFDQTTGIFTIESLNGSKLQIDTKLEKLAINWNYDEENKSLNIVLDDGTVQTVELADLIDTYTFEDSETIAFEYVGGDNHRVRAIVKGGSITEDMLQPNFLADCREEVEKAKAEVQNAKTEVENAKTEVERAAEQAQLAKRYAVGGVIPEDAEDNAKYYSEQAQDHADRAEQYSKITYPHLHIDMDTGHLVSTVGTGLSFSLDENGHLISEISEVIE